MAIIAAIGTATPAFQNSQSETAELISAVLNLKPSQKRILHAIYKATGIDYRYSVLSDYCKSYGELDFFPNNRDQPFPSTRQRMEVYQANALNLASDAISDCISQLSHFDLSSITHLITVSCTGMYAPGIDIELTQKLLNPNVHRTCVNFMGCYGAFSGLKLAKMICDADEKAKVLLVSVELCTLHFQKEFTIDNLLSNALFADGAAAVVVQSESSHTKHFSLQEFHCDLIPDSASDMAWKIADSGFDIVLSSYVPSVIKKGIREFFHNLSEKIQLSHFEYFAIHPGGIKILEACEESLNIPKEANFFAYEILKKYGNMSSATILFVLKEMLKNLFKNDDGKNVFSCAFGPGLTLESMILKTHCV